MKTRPTISIASPLIAAFLIGASLLIAAQASNLGAGQQGEVRPEASLTPVSHLPLGFKNYDWSSISDWTRTARIGTPYDYPDEEWVSWEHAVDRSVADGVNVLIDWECISDSYEGRILDPDSCLPDIQWMAEYVHDHHPGVRYIIYIAPLEMQTSDSDMNLDGADDNGKDSTYTDHPDWLQVGIDGRPAVFYGSLPGMPFWVDPTSEDVWLSPNVSEYRNLIMDLAQDMAATGIDGVWFDVPFLVHDFGEGWQEQWPDSNPEAQAQFLTDTGYPMPTAVAWDDPAWREWIAWRYEQTAGFIEEFNQALKSANPEIKLIIETSTGSGVNSTNHGSHVMDLPQVSDLTAHEFCAPYETPKYYAWPHMLSTLAYYRAVDGDHPSWMLTYVNEGLVDLARLHAATVLASGLNYYTSGTQGMTGMPDAAFRRQLFLWLEDRERTYYDPPLEPYSNVALLYSRQTLDYVSRGDWEISDSYDDYHGMAMLLLESHIPYRLITDRDLSSISQFDALIIPSFVAMSSSQAQAIRDYVNNGGAIIATGYTSLHNERGMDQSDFQLADVFGVHYNQADPDTVYVNNYGAGQSVFSPFMYGAEYYWGAAPDWEGGDPGQAEEARNRFLDEMWTQAGVAPILSTNAPREVMFLVFKRYDQLQVRIMNYRGVRKGDAVPTPLSNVTVTLELPPGMSITSAQKLSFLGNWQSQGFSQPDADHVQTTFNLNIHRVMAFNR